MRHTSESHEFDDPHPGRRGRAHRQRRDDARGRERRARRCRWREARAFFSPRKKLLLVTEGERFLGTLTPADLPATDDGPIGPHVNADPPRVAPGDPVSAALDLVEDDDMTRIPVVDASDQLLGLVCFNRSHEAFCVYPS